MSLEINKIYNGDCLELMKDIPDHYIDMILCDLPYGITSCKWDSVIPLDVLWKYYKRIIKEDGVICLTASQPFTSALVMSNVEMFKHEWIWIKNRGSNFANTVREPMKEHESVLIFAGKRWKYNKQMQERSELGKKRTNYPIKYNDQVREGSRKFEGRPHHSMTQLRVPSPWQKFNVEVGYHPTQKPVALFEYLIKTYSHEGDIILDNCAGSCTTAVAAENTNRNWICIEKEQRYCLIGEERISKNNQNINNIDIFESHR